MPIGSTDIKFYLSGGAANTNPNASLGGARSSTEIASGSLHNLFRKVTGDESAAGITLYRAFYVKNNHATLTWETVKSWFTALPAGGSIAMGLEPNTTPQSVANETTAPAGVSFTTPTTKAGGVALGDMAAGGEKMLWLRLTIAAGQAASNNNSFSVKTEGDTAA
jgi:hypothetical protein